MSRTFDQPTDGLYDDDLKALAYLRARHLDQTSKIGRAMSALRRGCNERPGAMDMDMDRAETTSSDFDKVVDEECFKLFARERRCLSAQAGAQWKAGVFELIMRCGALRVVHLPEGFVKPGGDAHTCQLCGKPERQSTCAVDLCVPSQEAHSLFDESSSRALEAHTRLQAQCQAIVESHQTPRRCGPMPWWDLGRWYVGDTCLRKLVIAWRLGHDIDGWMTLCKDDDDDKSDEDVFGRNLEEFKHQIALDKGPPPPTEADPRLWSAIDIWRRSAMGGNESAALVEASSRSAEVASRLPGRFPRGPHPPGGSSRSQSPDDMNENDPASDYEESVGGGRHGSSISGFVVDDDASLLADGDDDSSSDEDLWERPPADDDEDESTRSTCRPPSSCLRRSSRLSNTEGRRASRTTTITPPGSRVHRTRLSILKSGAATMPEIRSPGSLPLESRRLGKNGHPQSKSKKTAAKRRRIEDDEDDEGVEGSAGVKGTAGFGGTAGVGGTASTAGIGGTASTAGIEGLGGVEDDKGAPSPKPVGDAESGSERYGKAAQTISSIYPLAVGQGRTDLVVAISTVVQLLLGAAST